ncbi:group II intron maturase-specific domain-containing protein [Robertmurraya massiliosenegalensis]|uniref:group II intron maturase-specific domain-containing protein n=1 Tax=Robertmurraya massiliosenegalensis TaxID=1287657 RepID=UPI00036EF4D5|nr:group II intron maturase-specific domain-containing protein [Robertmurraya massiliosenegalensis]
MSAWQRFFLEGVNPLHAVVAEMLADGQCEYREVSGGGLISPLLANIYLHLLDELMTARGHRLIRYADDFVICCRSRKCRKSLKNRRKLLENELGLVVHLEKTIIVDNTKEKFTFLVYSFSNGYWHNPSEKSIKKFKDKMKKITRKNLTINMEKFIKHKVNSAIRGWGKYFGIGFSSKVFKEQNSWIRRRVKMIQLRSWEKIKKLHKDLTRKKWKGELPQLRMNRWRSSMSTPVHTALLIEWFREQKLLFLVDIHKELYSQGE